LWIFPMHDHILRDNFQKRFLEKTNLVNIPQIYGQHIRIVDDLVLKENKFEERIDDRDILMRFSKKEKIMILEEYLTFENDTTQSNKYYYFRKKIYGGEWVIPKAKNFTIQIEALFSFTKMLTKRDAPLFPVLIERETGVEINGNVDKMKQVYSIYREWLRQNKYNDFEKIELPLKNSPYRWSGEDCNIKEYILETL